MVILSSSTTCVVFCKRKQTHFNNENDPLLDSAHGEVKKRIHKMAAAFRNENSCVLMFYAVIRSLKLRKITASAKDAAPANLHNS